MDADAEGSWLRRLLDVGCSLTAELDQGIVLERVLEAGRELTGARYAALGVLDEHHSELERFVTAGIDEQTRISIGHLPRGRGVLGALIEHPQPLRLSDVSTHPHSYGFPAGHPPMSSFLGVPILIRGRAWGNLYLTEKADGDFTDRDEEAAGILAQWASVAIENARLYELSERRRETSERASRGLQVSRDVAAAVGGEVALERVLELIAKRGRALAEARSLVIWLRDGDDLVVAARAGHAKRDAIGLRVPMVGSVSGGVLQSRQPLRIADMSSYRGAVADELGVADAESALLVPMLHRGEAVGVLIVFDGVRGFDDDDEHLLQTFAVSAATAVALAQSVQAGRLRGALAAADAERGRWARELHGETLQGLGALRILLSSTLRRDAPANTYSAVRQALTHVEHEIENLRAIITELRPASLDELGLRAAVESLLDRQRQRVTFKIASELSILRPAERDARLNPDLESAVYRLVQEALNNVEKHAGARAVRVTVEETDVEFRVEVSDDGGGFDPETLTRGFGLAGMRERATLAGGTLGISSDGSGTLVRACLPLDGGTPRTPKRALTGALATGAAPASGSIRETPQPDGVTQPRFDGNTLMGKTPI